MTMRKRARGQEISNYHQMWAKRRALKVKIQNRMLETVAGAKRGEARGVITEAQAAA